jgi:putative MATE family efflux protein
MDDPARRPGEGSRAAGEPPRFVTGSLLRHVMVMSGTGAVGLMALFLADLATLVYLGLLRDLDVLAAVGYAGPVLFLVTSFGIGLSVAATAIVAPAIGARDMPRARRLAVSAIAMSVGVTAVLAIVLTPLLGPIMAGIGATGRPHQLAVRYLSLLMPSLPLLAAAMCASAILRSVGDARRSMQVTLAAAVVSVVLDPVFIFWFGLGMDGSVVTFTFARIAAVTTGLAAMIGTHGLWQRPRPADILADIPQLARVAVPAVLTNIATPFAAAVATWQIAKFGDAAIAAWALWGRLNPVAFGAVFSLTAAIGPIVGQNYGARRFDRVSAALTEALKANVIFCLVGWLALIAATPPLIRSLGLSEASAELVLTAVVWLSPLFAFLGVLFVANAAFNTLGAAHLATLFNWGRATVGTIPFVWLGGYLAGAIGAFAGSIAGAVPAALLAIWFAYRRVDALAGSGGAKPPP